MIELLSSEINVTDYGEKDLKKIFKKKAERQKTSRGINQRLKNKEMKK